MNGNKNVFVCLIITNLNKNLSIHLFVLSLLYTFAWYKWERDFKEIVNTFLN